MKKKILILSIISLALLTSCSKNTNKLITFDKSQISKDELFDKMSEKIGLQTVIDITDEKLLGDKYKSDDKEYNFLKEQKESIKKQYDNMYHYQYKTYEDFLIKAVGVTSEKELERLIRLSFKKKSLTEEYAKSLITEKELKEAYEKEKGLIRSSHILIKPQFTDKDDEMTKNKLKLEAKQKAQEILDRIKKNENFEKLAKEHSNDAKDTGGDIGYLDINTLEKPYAKVLEKLKVNEVNSELVETVYGYHIIKKTGEKKKESFDKLKSKLTDRLIEQKLKTVTNIQEKALIKYRKDKKFVINDNYLAKEYKNYVHNIENN